MKYVLVALAATYFIFGINPISMVFMKLLAMVLLIMLAFKLPRLVGEVFNPTRHM